MIKAGIALLFVVAVALSYYQGTKSCNSSAQTEEVSVNKNIVKHIVKRKLPNGTVETDTTVIDKSKEHKVEALIVKSVPPAANRIAISAVTPNFRDFTAYQLTYERRLVGPLWVGVSVNTKNELGLGVAYEF